MIKFISFFIVTLGILIPDSSLFGQCSSSSNPSEDNPTDYDNSLSIEENYNAARRWEETNLGLPANCLGEMVEPSVGWAGMSEDAIALYIHNSERVAREKLPLYDVEASLQDVAQAHGEWQIKNDVFSHGGDPSLGSGSTYKACSSCTSATGSSLSERINSDSDLNGKWELNGENLALNRTSGTSISNMVARGIYRWIYQDGIGWGHRENVLQTYTNGWGDDNTEGFIGVGLYGEDNYTYCSNCSHPDWYGKILVVDYYDPFASASGFSFKGLPIKLLAFAAKKSKSNVFLSWSTATELNNDYFLIEKSTDGLEFEELAKIDGAINSKSQKDYKYTDFNPVIGINYYRLKQVDLDGNFSYSNVEKVEFEIENTVVISPNPFDDFIIVNSSFKNDKSTIQIFNLKGETVFNSTIPAGNNTTKLYLPDLDSGIYFVKIKNSNFKKVFKLVKL